jgi:integrase
MLRVGRPRSKNKDLPLGVYPVDGRYHVRPVNEEMRRIFAVAFPGKKSAPLGADKAEMRKRWVQLFVTERPADTATAGTVAELIERFEREKIIDPKSEQARYCRTLRKELGARKYARSEAEASTGPFLRSMDVTRYLRAQEKALRRVAGNKEVQCLSRIFRLSKTEWGYTEYNPCLQVEYNVETPRGVYVSDDMFRKVYEKAPAIMQCMLELAQMSGARRGMLLKLTLADVTDDGVWLTPNKRKRNEAPRRRLVRWTDDLRAVIARVLELRAKARGGQKAVTDLDTAPLFLNREGKAFTRTGFNSMWQRARRAAGFTEAHELHFHDMKAKALSDSPTLEDAMNRGDHVEPRTTRRVYQRKPVEVIPLPRVGKKA